MTPVCWKTFKLCVRLSFVLFQIYCVVMYRVCRERGSCGPASYTGDEDNMPDPPPPAVLQLTAEQLQNIIAGSIAGALQQAQGQGLGGGTAGAAAAGSLPPCPLGRDKTKRYQQFRDWLTQAEAKMEFLAITESKRKVAYLRSSA